MKFNMKRVLALILAMMLSAACFTGCMYSEENKDSNTVAMIIDGENYYMDEYKLYTYASQYELENVYSIMILYYYGGYDQFFAQDWSEALSVATSKLYQTKALVKYAGENGIVLDEAEKAKVTETIAAFKENQKTMIGFAGADDAMIEKYITENALANKVYMQMVDDVDKTFDNAEFRRKKVEGVTVTALTEKPAEDAPDDHDHEEENEAAGEEGVVDEQDAAAEKAEEKAGDAAAAPENTEEENTEEEGEDAVDNSYTEEEQEAARKEAMEAIEARLKAGEELKDIISSYVGNERVSVTELAESTFSSEDAAEEGADITDYRQKAWSLATGEIACEIFVDENEGQEMGYCLRCVNDDDPELRKAAEDEELEARKKELFGKKFEPIAKKTKEFHIYEDKIVSAVKYKGQIHDALTVTGEDAEEFDKQNAENEGAEDQKEENAENAEAADKEEK